SRGSWAIRACVIGLATLLFGVCSFARAAPLPRAAFGALVAKCSPGVSPVALEAVAAKESHFDPLALHNNTRKLTVYAKDVTSAVLQARSWIDAGESVDLGLMQIHTTNLAPLGLTLERAFEPCASLG